MRYSLGFILALSLAGLQFLAIITVVSTSYVSSERAMLEHARGLMTDAGAVAMRRTIGFLEPASEAATLSSRMIQSDIVPATDTAALEALSNDVDTFRLVDRDIFWLRDIDAGESMENYALEKAIGIVGTRRTMNTVQRVVKKFGTSS